MAKAVWKYTLKVEDVIELSMPKGARVLTVQVQHAQPCMWAVVDTLAEPEVRRFRVAGTGHALDSDEWLASASAMYIGSFQLLAGHYVGHVFELRDNTGTHPFAGELELVT